MEYRLYCRLINHFRLKQYVTLCKPYTPLVAYLRELVEGHRRVIPLRKEEGEKMEKKEQCVC